VLGGISPIDPTFISLLKSYGLFEHLDAIGVHGFPLDWNHWQINDWPKKLEEIRAVTDLPFWVTEVGVSTFGADEVQVFGLQRTTELLLGRAERVFWYSLSIFQRHGRQRRVIKRVKGARITGTSIWG